MEQLDRSLPNWHQGHIESITCNAATNLDVLLDRTTYRWGRYVLVQHSADFTLSRTSEPSQRVSRGNLFVCLHLSAWSDPFVEQTLHLGVRFRQKNATWSH